MRFLLVLLLTSCTLQNRAPLNPIVESYQVNVIGLEFCEKSWGMAVSYLYSEGIRIVQNDKGRRVLVCLPTNRGVVSVLKKIIVPSVEAQGYSQGNLAWAKISGYENQDAKVIVHELMHLLKNEPHHWRGLMFPISDFLVFAGGL